MTPTLATLSVLLAADAAAWQAPPQLRPSTLTARTLSSRRSVPAPLCLSSSYAELHKLGHKVRELLRDADDMLLGFYDAERACFALTPGRPRLSITSTCFGLLAIDADPLRWRASPELQPEDVVQSLFNARWRDEDMFQLTLIVCAARLLDPACLALQRHPELQGKFGAAVSTILDARPSRQRRDGTMSAYVRYWSARAMLLLVGPNVDVDSGADADAGADGSGNVGGVKIVAPELPTMALPSDADGRVMLSLQRSAEAAYDDVCRQLAFRYAEDGVSFDPVTLAYSLATYVSIGLSLAKASAMPRSLEARDAVGTGSALPPYNPRIVAAALSAVIGQLVGGTWAKGQPIFLSRGGGNDVGNAFAFAPDVLATLLEDLPDELFRPHVAAISSHVQWLQTHQVMEVVQTHAEADVHRARQIELRGWRSDHLPPEGGPLAWSTAQALRCLSRVRELTNSLINTDVLAELGGRTAGRPDPAAWDRLLDSDLTDVDVADAEPSVTLKCVLEDRMLKPLGKLAAADPLGRDGAGASFTALEAAASYSAILFGPPGTAKTTVVDAIASRLGWGFVAIDTSMFLSAGLSNVASRIAEIFDMLMQLRRVVVLFDEVEEFCLDRSNPSLGMESRMLTTAMLTKLADLRGRRQVAFFIATNRLTALDAAVTRPGRFDLQLFVGTPNLPARMARFRKRLQSALPPVDGDGARATVDAATAAAAFEAVLKRRWKVDARYLTYLETEKLAADSVALLSEVSDGDPEHIEADIERLLDAQAAIMTVRGAVREDFDEFTSLSRT